MTVYSERTNTTILSMAGDADGDPLSVLKVNGQESLVGVPIPLSVGGAVTVTAQGVVTFDDQGFTVPDIGDYVADGLIATITDGSVEVDTAVNLELYGAVSAGVAVFGALTRPFEGGVPAPDGATSIVAGDPNNHFAISNGMILPTLAGSGVMSGTYLLTMNNGTNQELAILPGVFSVSKDAELSSLLSDATQPFDGHTIQLRPGQYDKHTMPAVTFVSGGVTITSDGPGTQMRQLFIDHCWGNPEVVVRGIAFTSDVVETEAVNRLYYARNDTPNGVFRIEDCRFEGHPGINADPSVWYAKLDYTGAGAVPVVGERIDNDGGGDTGAYTTILEVLDNGDGSGTLYVDDNPGQTNGGSSDNQGVKWLAGQVITSDGGWTATLSTDLYGGDDTLGNGIEGGHAFAEMYVEQCQFSRLKQAMEVAATTDVVVRDNVGSDLMGDFIKIHCPTKLPPTNQTLVERNMLSRGMVGGSDYSNPHRDGVQLSGNRIVKDWEHMILRDNVFWTGASERPAAKANNLQPLFLETKNGSGYGLRGAQIQNNITDSGGGGNGIILDYAYDCIIENNTCVSSLLRNTNEHNGALKIIVGKSGTDGACVIKRNVTETLSAFTNDESGNVTTDKYFDFSAYFPAWTGAQDFEDVSTLFTSLTPGAATPVMSGSNWDRLSDHGCINEAGRFIGHDGSDLTQHFLDLEGLREGTFFVVPDAAPGAFETSDWSLSDTGTGGSLEVTITALPFDGGAPILDVQASANGGAFASLGGTTPGTYILSGLTDDEVTNVTLRAVNSAGLGEVGDALMQTPTRSATEPDQFGAGDWAVADAGTGGTLDIVITSLPYNGGASLQGIEASVNGAAFTSLGTTETGTYALSELTNDVVTTIRLRALNGVGAGPESAGKSATPTLTITPPAQFGTGDWSVSDAAAGGSVDLTLTQMPDDGGAALTDVQYSVDSGAFTSLGLSAPGTVQVTGLVDDVEVQFAIRAVNAAGSGAVSATKSVTPTPQVIELDESFSALDPSFARMVYDTDRLNGGNAADIPISVSDPALANTALEGRALGANGTATPWGAIGTADASGDLSATLTGVPRALTWYKWQVRKAAAPEQGGTTVGEFGVGDVLAFFGQSPLDQSFLPNSSLPNLEGPEVLTVVTGNTTVEHIPITLGNEYGSALSYLNDMIAATSDAVVMVVDLARSGTGRAELADDSDQDRRWVDLEDKVNHVRAAGSDISLIYETWHTFDIGALSTDAVGNFLPFYTGVDASGTKVDYGTSILNSYTLDHSLFDMSGDGRGLFDETRTKMVMATPYGNAFAPLRNYFTGPDGVANNNSRIRLQARDQMALLNADPNMAAVLAQVGPYAIDVRVETGGTIHLENGDEFGRPHILRTGVAAMLMANGVIADSYSGTTQNTPEITGITWAATHADVNVSVPAGRQLTTTAIARGLAPLGTAQPHFAEVMGFEVGQSELHDVLPTGFTAQIHDAAAGIIRITPENGSFEPGARIAFARGSAVPVFEESDKATGTHLYMPLVTCGAGGGYEGLPLRPNVEFVADSIGGGARPAAVATQPGLGVRVLQSGNIGSGQGGQLTLEYVGTLQYIHQSQKLISMTGNKLDLWATRDGEVRFRVKGNGDTTLFDETSAQGLIHHGWTQSIGRVLHIVATCDMATNSAHVWMKDESGAFVEILTPSFTTTETEYDNGRGFVFGDAGTFPLQGNIQKMAVYFATTSTGDTSALTPYLIKTPDAASFNSITNAGTGPNFAAPTNPVTDA